MSAYTNSNSRHFRASSFQQDNSACSVSLSTEEYYNHNVGHIRHYLAKFEEPLDKSTNISRQQDSRNFSAPRDINETSYSDLEQKSKETGEFTVKIDMARRIGTLEQKMQDLTQKFTREAPRGGDMRQEDLMRVNDRVSGIERRMDTMDRKLEKLMSTLGNFMQKFPGQGYMNVKEDVLMTAPDEKRSSAQYGDMRKEIPHETGERLTEIKLLGNSATKAAQPGKEIEQRSLTQHRRTQSRDGLDVRDRVREALDQARRKDDMVLQTRHDNFVAEPKVFSGNMEQPDRNKVPMKSQEKHVDRSPEPKGAPKQLKGSLRSPDSARKRKNVSWTENCVSEGNIEEDHAQKRKRTDTSDISEFGRYGYEQKREMAQMGDENKYSNYEKQTKYSGGETRTEKIKSDVEKLEEKLRKIETNGRSENMADKERQLEEKRRKIDEEIQRRINRQSEVKKRVDASEGPQRRVNQYEDELKTSSCNVDFSGYKDVVPRNELIAKYSDIVSSGSKRSKNV